MCGGGNGGGGGGVNSGAPGFRGGGGTLDATGRQTGRVRSDAGLVESLTGATPEANMIMNMFVRGIPSLVGMAAQAAGPENVRRPTLFNDDHRPMRAPATAGTGGRQEGPGGKAPAKAREAATPKKTALTPSSPPGTRLGTTGSPSTIRRSVLG